MKRFGWVLGFFVLLAATTMLVSALTPLAQGSSLRSSPATDFTPASTNVAPFTISQPIQVGNSPADNAYDPIHGWWLVANTLSNDVSVIQANDSKLVATVPVGTSPTGIEVLYNRTTNFDQAWTTNYDDDTVSSIQLANLTVTHVIPVGSEPDKICFAPSLHEAFVMNYASDNISVITTTISHAVLGNISLGYNPNAPVGGWDPDGCVFDPDTDPIDLWVSSGNGQQVIGLDVRNWEDPVWVANYSGINSPGAMSLSPDPHDATWVAESGSAAEVVIDHDPSPHIATVINVGSYPEDSDYDSGTSTVWVVNTGSDDVSVLSVTSDTVIATVNNGPSPSGIVYDPTDGLVLVCSSSGNYCQDISDGTGGTNGTLFPGPCLGPCNARPTAPTDLYAYPSTTTQILLTWINPSGVLIDNTVFVYSGGVCASLINAINLEGVYVYTYVSSLHANTTYSFTVDATSSNGAGPPSGCTNATTEANATGGGGGGAAAIVPSFTTTLILIIAGAGGLMVVVLLSRNRQGGNPPGLE